MKTSTGLYGKAKIENLDGEVAGLTEKVTYKLNIFSSFELTESLDEIKRLTRGALDKLSGSGPVSLNLHLSGGGGQGLNYSGKVDFLNAVLSHTSIPIDRFTSVKGSVGFENELLVFNDLKAMNGGSAITMNGTLEKLSSPRA